MLPLGLLEHGGEDCWSNCKKSGKCDWCGTQGFCCRKGVIGGGCDGWGGPSNHQCFLRPTGDKIFYKLWSMKLPIFP